MAREKPMLTCVTIEGCVVADGPQVAHDGVLEADNHRLILHVAHWR